MALSDWLNATTIGDATLKDVLNTGKDIYDVYQQGQANKDYINKATEGYQQGISTVKNLGEDTRDILNQVYGTSRGDITPYLNAGQTSLDQYMNLLQNPSAITEDPGYQFRLAQGQETLARQLAKAGYADPMGSGAFPVGMTEYAQNFATNELDKALNRRLPIISEGGEATRTGAGIGRTQAAGMANLNQNMSNALTQLYQGKADTSATKYIVDSLAKTGYLKGASGLLDKITGTNAISEVIDLVNAALGGQTTSDGVPLWDMIAESFGFNPNDTGIVQQVIDSIGGKTTDIYGSMGDFLNVGGTENGIQSLFKDIGINKSDLGDTIDWDNLFFSEGGGLAGLGAGVDAGAIVPGGYSAATESALSNAITSGLNPSLSSIAGSLAIPAAIYGGLEFITSFDTKQSQLYWDKALQSNDPFAYVLDKENLPFDRSSTSPDAGAAEREPDYAKQNAEQINYVNRLVNMSDPATVTQREDFPQILNIMLKSSGDPSMVNETLQKKALLSLLPEDMKGFVKDILNARQPDQTAQGYEGSLYSSSMNDSDLRKKARKAADEIRAYFGIT